MRFELDIREGDCRIVAARTDAFEGELSFEHALARVSEHRRNKALAYRFDKDRQLSLLAGLLLGALLGERGLHEHDMAYVANEQGKPAFRDFPHLHFSLAHSGQMAVAALAGASVGVDVERLSDFPHDIADPHDWTRMESVAKALGCGVGAFVDGKRFTIPHGMRVQHIGLDDYLLCIAMQPPQRGVACYTLQNG